MSVEMFGWICFAAGMGGLLSVVFMAWLQAWRDTQHDDEGCRCWRDGYLQRGRDQHHLNRQIGGRR